jgi:hypothetical protein
MNLVKHTVQADGLEHIQWHCPATGDWFLVVVKGYPGYKMAVWKWNGSLDKPTLEPSVLRRTFQQDGVTVRSVNHFFMKEGAIAFRKDSTHDRKGQTVPMAEWRDI